MNLKWLLNHTCYADDGAPDAGGGGGAPAPEPAPTPESGGGEPDRVGGAEHADYDHRFPAPQMPSDDEVNNVSRILGYEKDADHRLSFEDIGALMGFNPPLKPPTQAQQPAPQAAPKAPVAPQGQPAPAPEAAKPALSPDTQAIIEALRANQPQQPAAPAQAPTSQEPAKPVPYYGEGGRRPAPQISPEFADVLFNAEDPAVAVQALNSLVHGIMNQVMQDVAQDRVQGYQYLLSQIPQMVQVQHQARSTTEQFYGMYPELNKGPLHGVTKALAERLAQQRQAANQPLYDEGFYKTLGEAVHSYVKQSLGIELPRGNQPGPIANAPAPQPQPQPAAQPRPNGQNGQPWMSPGGSRPPAGPGVRDKSAEMFNLIGFE